MYINNMFKNIFIKGLAYYIWYIGFTIVYNVYLAGRCNFVQKT